MSKIFFLYVIVINSLASENILVTGCCGFIGVNLCKRLLENKEYSNYKIIGLDNMDPFYSITQKKNNLEILSKFENFEFINEDIITTKAITRYKPIYVCNLAARAGVRPSLEEPIRYCRVNIEGNINLLEECVKNNVKKYVYASSSSVYGLNSKVPFSEEDPIDKPNSVYACTKKSMEDFCKCYHKLYGLPVIGLRFFTVYGPHGRPDMAPYKFLKSIMEEKEIHQFGDGSSFRDYTYIDDIVDGIIGAIFNCSKKCEVYNLGNHSPTTLKEFIHLCEKTVGKKAKILYKDNQLGDVPKTYADVRKAYVDFGFYPKTKIEEGLQKTFEWLSKD